MDRPTPLFSIPLDRALRRAAGWHREHLRKGGSVPYITHPVAVAITLDRLGFGEDVIVAGLLHDVVEDSGVTVDELSAEFGPVVAGLVADCSEVKLDASGGHRPWIDRKRDYLESLSTASVEARAVALADKLHNLVSILSDLRDGRPVWPVFHAGREDVLWYYRTAIARFSEGGDPRLGRLAEECRSALAEIELLGAGAGLAYPPPAPGL